MTLQLGEPSLSGKAFPDYEVREVYLNDGKELSGATSGIVYKDRLLIGSAVSNLLYCEVKFYWTSAKAAYTSQKWCNQIATDRMEQPHLLRKLEYM